MKISMKKIFVLVSILFIVGVVSYATYFHFKNQREPSLYLIPSGYTGFVTIHFGKKGSPELTHEGKYVLYPIPNDGVLNTSSTEPQYGAASDKYYYVDEKGNRKEIEQGSLIHGGGIGTAKSGPPTLRFFIGTEEQFNSLLSK